VTENKEKEGEKEKIDPAKIKKKDYLSNPTSS